MSALKIPLEVYYYIDEESQFLERYLTMYINLRQQNFRLVKIEKYNLANEYTKEDIMRDGMLIFNEMYTNLKLKTQNTVWFFYIANGNIKEYHKDVFLILLNRNPADKELVYIMYKEELKFGKMGNEEKKEKMNILSKIIVNLFESNKIIKYYYTIGSS